MSKKLTFIMLMRNIIQIYNTGRSTLMSVKFKMNNNSPSPKHPCPRNKREAEYFSISEHKYHRRLEEWHNGFPETGNTNPFSWERLRDFWSENKFPT